MGKYLWIDCDPGVDDAATIIVAAKSNKEIVGISAVSGNVLLDKTYENARRLVSFADLRTKVYKGAKKPLTREPVTAAYIHKEDGLGGVSLPATEEKEEEKKAWDALYDAINKYGKELEILAIGPLTNIAIALMKYPDIKDRVERIIIMGGSTTAGNITPAAEFNIYVDPEAAHRVFESGIEIIMFGLDVTMKAYLTDEDFKKFSEIDTKQSKFLEKCLRHSLEFSKQHGLKGVALHDVCTVLYLEKPELFKMKEAFVGIETDGEITRGRTITDLYSDKKIGIKNTKIVLDVDRESFLDLFFEMLSRN